MEMTPKKKAMSFLDFAINLDKAFDMQFPIPDRRNLVQYLNQNVGEAIDIALEEQKKQFKDSILLLRRKIRRIEDWGSWSSMDDAPDYFDTEYSVKELLKEVNEIFKDIT